MKKIFAVIVVLILTAISAFADTATVVLEKGDLGEFQYPWIGGGDNEFVIWHAGRDGSKTGEMSGEITSKTIVKIANRTGIAKANLDLLTGKRVMAYGKLHQIGVGEGSRMIYDELTIFIIPE